MAATYIFTTALLTLAWCIMCESFAVPAITAGVIVSSACMLFVKRYLPLYKLTGVSVPILITYPFYLFATIYKAAFTVVKMIFKKPKASIITVQTGLTNEFLNVVLAQSITVTPGTITLDMGEGEITILCLDDHSQASKGIAKSINKIDRRLIKAQKTQ